MMHGIKSNIKYFIFIVKIIYKFKKCIEKQTYTHREWL